MNILKIAALLVIAGTAARASAYGVDRFVDQKSGYNVAVGHIGDRMILDGRHPVTGSRFHLVVTPTGAVSGTWEGHRVDYKMDSHEAVTELTAYEAGR